MLQASHQAARTFLRPSNVWFKKGVVASTLEQIGEAQQSRAPLWMSWSTQPGVGNQDCRVVCPRRGIGDRADCRNPPVLRPHYRPDNALSDDNTSFYDW